MYVRAHRYAYTDYLRATFVSALYNNNNNNKKKHQEGFVRLLWNFLCKEIWAEHVND